MTKTPPRRSIISNFSALAAGTPAHADPAPEQKGGFLPPTSGVIPARIAAGVIGATQRTLTDMRVERDRLQAQVEAGGLREVDATLVDASPFPDRLPDDDDISFAAFRNLIAEEGQKVPVQLRRHPALPGRYQLVYGHRRWRAALDLRLPLKALLVEMTDRDLVMAQGIENAARQDLSWIEKALFAWRMDNAGFKARDIRVALMVDDPELARFRAVCRALPIDLIEAIGRAPKAGRPRWVDLAQRVALDGDLVGRLKATLASAKDRTSDERFAALTGLVQKPVSSGRATIALKAGNGAAIGKAVLGGQGVQIRMIASQAAAFNAFMEDELPGLIERFLHLSDER